jgi:hypothetical protein
LRCVFLLIHICIIAILALIPVYIIGFQVKAPEFSHGPLSPAGGGDGITFVTFLVGIPAADWDPEMKSIIFVIIVYRDVSVSASDLRFLKRHFRGQLVKKNSLVNTHCVHHDHHGKGWVLDCSKDVDIHPLLVALWLCVPGIHQECMGFCNAR